MCPGPIVGTLHSKISIILFIDTLCIRAKPKVT
jgi:hypothetical protein